MNKPTIFDFKPGLPTHPTPTKIVFEKFLRTALDNMKASKIYENGDIYIIEYNNRTNFDNNNTKWIKRGELTKDELDEIQKIAQSNVTSYLNKGPYKKYDTVLENCKWYFYFNETISAETQKRQWRWWTTPSFVKRIDRIIENNAREYFMKNFN